MSTMPWSFGGMTKKQAAEYERRREWLKARRPSSNPVPSRSRPVSAPIVDEVVATKLDIQALSAAMPVPAPSEREPLVGASQSGRDGQSEFRKCIVSAYGRCAVTGCSIEGALDAAHIIPYVDDRSNLVSNGLCLRADIHRLYDRNLLQVGADLVVRLSAPLLETSYRAVNGRRLRLPRETASWPNRELLAVRHLFVSST